MSSPGDLILVTGTARLVYHHNKSQPQDPPTGEILEVGLIISAGYYVEDKYQNLWFVPKDSAEVVFTT